MYKFYTLKNLTREELNELARERNSLEQERDKYKQMYEMEKALFIDADLKIERAIEYINQNWDGSSYIDATLKSKVAELNISELEAILKGDNSES